MTSSDPSVYPSQPAQSQGGYASPQPHSQPPTYAQPQYGGYQQPPPGPPVDGVSIAAFVTGLWSLGPVAVILAVFGLRRTANQVRSGRWAAWAGLVLGILGTLAYVVLIVAVVWIKENTYVGDSSTTRTDTSERPVYVPPPDTYGEDSYLDGLWDACEAGDMGACDQLSADASIGSGYWRFGDNCGTVGRELPQLLCDE